MSASIHVLLNRPHIVPEPLGGFYVILGSHGWLCGSRREAIDEFDAIIRIERTGSARGRA
jgi:hypothetical protein